MSRRVFHLPLILPLFFLISSCASLRTVETGPDYRLEKGRFKSSAGEKLDYYLLSLNPENSQEQFPLLLAIHGAGGDGRGMVQSWKEAALKHRVMILAPTRRYDYGDYSGRSEVFYELIEKIKRERPVSAKGIYLSGTSAGAVVARQLLIQNPTSWDGVIFIASPASLRESWPEKVRDAQKFPPLLYAHGLEDPMFSYLMVLKDIRLLKWKGVSVDLIMDPAAKHEQRKEWNDMILGWIEEKMDAR